MNFEEYGGSDFFKSKYMAAYIASFFKREIKFITLIGIFIIVCLVFYDSPKIAMWVGFGLAGYSSIANDSIQTLGTFLSSNSHRKWWILWLFIGCIMIVTHLTGWLVDGGDVAFGRLARIPQPLEFTFFQLMAPVILIILTRFKMPVSTTFLILSVFSTAGTIEGMVIKTVLGYIVAFVVALIIWNIYVNGARGFTEKRGRPHHLWYVAQWIMTAFLWSTWLMQDTANLAVFLPRTLGVSHLIGFLGFLFLALGVLFYLRGDRIQEIVTEKTDVLDVRSATMISAVLGVILLVFKEVSDLPMSTTWVFLGLLAGRELALSRVSKWNNPYNRSLKLVIKDIGRATTGLAISLLLALFINGNL